MKVLKNTAWVLLIALTTQWLSACVDFFETSFLDSAVAETLNYIPTNSPAAAYLNRLEAAVGDLKNAVNTAPIPNAKLTGDLAEAREWIATNKPKIDAWLGQVGEKAEVLHKIIYQASKDSLESKEPSDKGDLQLAAYYGIRYSQLIHHNLVQMLLPLAVAVGVKDWGGDETVRNFRGDILLKVFENSGANVVLAQDQRTVLNQLGLNESKNILDSKLSIVAKLESQNAQLAAEEREKAQQIMKSMPQEQKEKFAAALAEYRKKMANVSFLYVPGKNYNLVVNVLAWIGNLTWGLVNTMIGASIVVAAMAVSPFTPYVDFPTLRISQNGNQIYADVTGINPLGLAGKMSMGIFELDNGAGASFASEHEGGHAIQSAILGPFYLPTVLTTYLIFGFDQGPMEWWAWSAAETWWLH